MTTIEQESFTNGTGTITVGTWVMQPSGTSSLVVAMSPSQMTLARTLDTNPLTLVDIPTTTVDEAYFGTLTRRTAQPTPEQVIRALATYATERNEWGMAKDRQLTDEVERHHADVKQIGEALLSEAESRDWCSDYDEFVEGVNRRLNVPLIKRTRQYQVTVDVTYRVMVEVEATDADAARDKVRDHEWDQVTEQITDDPNNYHSEEMPYVEVA